MQSSPSLLVSVEVKVCVRFAFVILTPCCVDGQPGSSSQSNRPCVLVLMPSVGLSGEGGVLPVIGTGEPANEMLPEVASV